MSNFGDIIEVDNFFKGVKVIFVGAICVAVGFGIYAICEIGELLNLIKCIGLTIISIIGFILISIALFIVISSLGWMVNFQIPNLQQKYKDWRKEGEYLPISHQIAEEYDVEVRDSIQRDKINRFFVKGGRWYAEVTDKNGDKAINLSLFDIFCKKKGDTSTTYLILRLEQFFDERKKEYEKEKKENNKGWFKKCFQLSK